MCIKCSDKVGRNLPVVCLNLAGSGWDSRAPCRSVSPTHGRCCGPGGQHGGQSHWQEWAWPQKGKEKDSMG